MVEPIVDSDVPANVIDVTRPSRWAATARIAVSDERGRESLALGVGAVALAVAGLITLVIFRLQPLPITGGGSIGQHGAITSAVVAFVTFVAGRCVVPAPAGAHRALHVLDVAALALAHGAIALVSWTLLAGVIESGFNDALVFGFPSMLIAGTLAGLTGYVVFHSATHMSVSLLAVILALFLVEGVIASMLTAGDPHWWKEDLSALGETDDTSALAFNLTLTVGGLMVTTLGRYAARGIPTTHVDGLARVRMCLTLIGISLALVGVFPADDFYWVHTGFACAIAVLFAVLIAFLPWWIPGMPRLFMALGWLFIAILVVQFVLFATGYYTLTAVELVVGTLVIGWIILFIRNAAAAQRDSRGDDGPRA